MLIGQVSKLTGVSDDRIRNYDKKGLIVVDTDNKTGYRIFNEEHIWQINFISHLQDIGLKIN